jgi:hypothetical protein
VTLAQARWVVAEGDIPLRIVIRWRASCAGRSHGPVLAQGDGAIQCGEGARGDDGAGLGAGRRAAPGGGLGAEQADGAGRAQLAGRAPVAREPVGLAQDAHPALLDAAVALGAVDPGREAVWGFGGSGLDLCALGARRVGWLASTASSSPALWAAIA